MRRAILAAVLLTASTQIAACGRVPPATGADELPVSPAASPSPTQSYSPGPNFTSGRVIRRTLTGVVIRSAEEEVEVDLRPVVDIWKETSVPESAIEVGDDLDVNGTRGATAFIARYVYVNIGRLDGVILAFDGREILLGIQRTGQSVPSTRRVELSASVEIVRPGSGGERPDDRSDLTPGRRIGMVIYAPRQGLPRATRIWSEPDAPLSASASGVLTRPSLAASGPIKPVALTAAPAAGIVVMRMGGTWWYDGARGQVLSVPTVDEGTEHWSPAGGVIAVERLSPTVPGGRYQIAKELALREQGIERVIYRTAGDGFYWSGWSPDGRYAAIWEIDTYSGSIDMDGRPLVVIDVRTGERTELGRTLLSGTTTWTAPHTLAFVSGMGRMVSDTKTLRLWSPEGRVRDAGIAAAAIAPVWSTDGRSLWVVSGPSGRWDLLEAAAGRGVGDRGITRWDAETGRASALAHEPGYVEEGVRPSRDGKHLLVLRRPTVSATDIRSIPALELELWLTDAGGAHGIRLVRFSGSGLSAYGYPNGPSEWGWTE